MRDELIQHQRAGLFSLIFQLWRTVVGHFALAQHLRRIVFVQVVRIFDVKLIDNVLIQVPKIAGFCQSHAYLRMESIRRGIKE